MYVATTGSDSANDCKTSGSPCLTINHATQQAVAGDHVLVQPGTYNETVAFANNGTSGNFIALECANHAVVNGKLNASAHCVVAQAPIAVPTSGQSPTIIDNSKNYNEVIGFELSGGNQGIINVAAAPVSVGGSGVVDHHHCEIDNYVHGTAGDALGAQCSDYIYLYDNIVSNSAADNTYMGSNMSIYSPVAADSGGGFHIWVSHNTSRASFQLPGASDGSGLILDNWSNGQDNCPPGIVPYGKPALVDANLFYSNAGPGFKLYDPGTIANITVRDNTAYFNLQNTTQTAEFLCQVCAGTVTWANNIALTQYPGNTAYSTTGVTSLSNNLSLCYSGGVPQLGSACGLSAGNGNQLGVDPLFANLSIPDFHLQSGSPALGAGTSNFGTPATYLDGAAPPSPIDLGALGQSSPGCQNPSAPLAIVPR